MPREYADVRGVVSGRSRPGHRPGKYHPQDDASGSRNPRQRNDLKFADQADSEIWKERLTKAKPLLDEAIRAVGRIDLQGARLDWVGTGWLVADNILVTNRHVAREFARVKATGSPSRSGLVDR